MCNVLVPGGGGPAAIGAIKSLRRAGFSGKIVTTDANPLSAGFLLADSYCIVPEASSPAFIEEALALLEREQIAVILPSSGFDIEPYSRNKQRIEAVGTRLAFSDYSVVVLCHDKLKLFETIGRQFEMGWFTAMPEEASFPCFVKPRRGKGSRGVYHCVDREELMYALAAGPEMVIQEFFPGREYTIDVLSDMDGKALIAVPRERLETKAGISSKGRIIKNTLIQQQCMKIAEYIGLKGPSCFQMKEDKNGIPRLQEINPRLGGGTIFATLAGINIPYYAVLLCLGRPCTIPAEFREITIVRYYEEVVLNLTEAL